ncbi:MAG: sialidase family protein [Lentisphaeria bacterium]
MKRLKLVISFASLLATVYAVDAPKVVGVPPADAGRGLVRVSENEIRHYSGDRGKVSMVVSRDNGLTWNKETAGESYPRNFGGIPKESPAIIRNPVTNEFIRVQPKGGFVFQTKGGLDGQWLAATKDGKLSADWVKSTSNLVSLGGIMRNPTFVNKGKRILIPAHDAATGTWLHLSDDGGATWRKSKDTVLVPAFEMKPPHHGNRWRNNGVEGTIVELKDGRLWMILRCSQDQYWQSYSSDFGDTWTKAEPSRFFGTLTMPTIGRLSDGRLLMLWTNTMALPENKSTAKSNLQEDAFTNRDSHHAAISSDEGKTWIGFREIILDEHRNRSDYATFSGRQDRGKHQSEFMELDKNRVLISLGQHAQHRKLVILDTRWLYEKSRSNSFENGLDDWTIHTYIPVKAGHCAYNRKPSAFLVNHPDSASKKVMQVKRTADTAVINIANEVNYERGGATWNFPNGRQGKVELKFYINEVSGGVQLSLMDRLFNACDVTANEYSQYTFAIGAGKKLGNFELKAKRWYTLSLQWSGVGEKGSCRVSIDGKLVTNLKINKTSPNGISYLHLVSTALEADNGVLIESIKASVK